MTTKKLLAVIGGGAAGFFGAINFALKNPEARVILIEKTGKLLSKVRVSGGGRCNVTHRPMEPSQLVQNYPRGGKQLRSAFERFASKDTIGWFESRGVELKVEDDGRMFPVTDDSETIASCLMDQADIHGVEIRTHCPVYSVEKGQNGGFVLNLPKGEQLACDSLLLATGGSPSATGYEWIRNLGHSIVEPTPSLFTFNVPDSPLKGLEGISMPEAVVKISGTKLSWKGPVLVTHWGFSGPAVLKLSAWGARDLSERGYRFQFTINWSGAENEEAIRRTLEEARNTHPKKVIQGNPLFGIPSRLWVRLAEMAEIEPDRRWMDIPKKNFNKLVNELFTCTFQANGKTTFKEEFVTAGGVKLEEVNFKTMESKICPGLFFAGEVLDIDGITGGFNFQAAWTTSWVAAQSM